MTVKELLRELQKEKYDEKHLPVKVIVNGHSFDLASVTFNENTVELRADQSSDVVIDEER